MNILVISVLPLLNYFFNFFTINEQKINNLGQWRSNAIRRLWIFGRNAALNIVAKTDLKLHTTEELKQCCLILLKVQN